MERREDKSCAIQSRLQMLLSPQRGKGSLAQTRLLVNTSRSKINSDISAKTIHFLIDIITPTHVFQAWFDDIFFSENCWSFPRSREQITASLTIANRVV